MNKINKENIKHQIAEFQDTLIAACDSASLDLNNIKFKYLGKGECSLKSGEFYLNWKSTKGIYKLDLFIDGKRAREIKLSEFKLDFKDPNNIGIIDLEEDLGLDVESLEEYEIDRDRSRGEGEEYE